MKQKVVQVNRLTKRFGPKKGGFVAVNDISFSIDQGEIVGLLGRNGAGKTTTLHMLLGLVTPTSGTIEILGKSLTDKREEILSEINFSSTYTHLPWRLTVWENLHVVALLYAVKNAKQKVEKVIEKMGLTKYRNTEVGGLSSGWVTRLNMARTFLNDPKFILLDEPTASLDPEAAAQVRAEILEKRKKNGTTVLWTSHNMAEVEEVCDRVIFLDQGKIIAWDTPAGLAKKIHVSRVNLMIEKNKEKLASLVVRKNWRQISSDRFETIELTEEEIPLLLSMLSEEKILYNQITIEKPTLEDFFLSLKKHE